MNTLINEHTVPVREIARWEGEGGALRPIEAISRPAARMVSTTRTPLAAAIPHSTRHVALRPCPMCTPAVDLVEWRRRQQNATRVARLGNCQPTPWSCSPTHR